MIEAREINKDTVIKIVDDDIIIEQFGQPFYFKADDIVNIIRYLRSHNIISVSTKIKKGDK